MRNPRTHKFLVWAGPTLVVFFGGCLAIFAALAQAYPKVRDWGQAQFDHWWPVVSSGWFIVLCVAVILAYLAALIYTDQEARSPRPKAPAIPLPAPQPPERLPAPVAAPPKVAEVALTKLLARREVLTEQSRFFDGRVALCRQEVERYRQSLARFSASSVARPEYDDLWPERILPSVLTAFMVSQIRDASWAETFNRPKPNIEQTAAKPASLPSNRQFFDPEHNRRYIGLHRENLVQLEEALEDLENRASDIHRELGQVQGDIQAEARRING